MLILLSPAKDLREGPVKSPLKPTRPVLLDAAVPIASKLSGFSAKRLGQLMDISPKLAALNHARYQQWALPFTADNAMPAGFLFNGEAYKGLDLPTADTDTLRFLQRHLRILSGLYGVLRPLDLVMPYRLEMGTALSVGRAKDLYGYWRPRIAPVLLEDLRTDGSGTVLNLASAEYAKAVDFGALKARVITPVFKDRVGGGYRMLMVFAKHQRGAMARWVAERRLEDPADLVTYDGDGYRYAPAESTPDAPVFLRDAR